MTIYDMHSHWGTKRGYTLRTEAELAQQKKTWNSEPKYATEEEMAAYFRKCNVRVILDFGFDKYLPLNEAAEIHDYGFETQRKYPDVILASSLIDDTLRPSDEHVAASVGGYHGSTA